MPEIYVTDKSAMEDHMPHKAWKCGRGGFGCVAYTHAVPAIKVQGDGP